MSTLPQSQQRLDLADEAATSGRGQRLLNRLRKPFRRHLVRPLALRFDLDQLEDGKHKVTVFAVRDGQKQAITNPRELTRYGYQEVVETTSEVTTYVLESASLGTLLALQSLNPHYDLDGTMTFDMSPAILLHLRESSNIHESSESQRTQVSQSTLKPQARIEFEPQEGITVETGYVAPGSEELIPAEHLQLSSDGNYAKVGPTWFRIPRLGRGSAADWLKQPLHKIPLHAVPEFYVRDLAPLQKELAAVLTDRVRELRVVRETFKPIVYLDQKEKGWLSFNVTYQVGAHTLTHEQMSGDGTPDYLQVDDKTWIKTDFTTIGKTTARMQKLGAVMERDGYRVPAREYATVEEFVLDLGGQTVLSQNYQDFIAQLTGFRADDTFRLSAGTEKHLAAQSISLRPYQRAGIHWLTWLHDNQLHGLLADDMGLGKTLQGILTLRQAYEQGGSKQPSLIVAPASVLVHWERELRRFYPELRTYRYHGPGRSMKPLLTNERVAVISTYDTVRSSIENLATIPFFYVILDEATSIKNPDSARSKAIKALNSSHRLSLSGTPVENRPAELWSIYDFLMTGHLGAYGTFERVFENQIMSGNQEAAQRLGRRIRPFMLRRLKEEVARDLPDKIEMDEWCHLTPEQSDLYAQIQAQAKPVLQALAANQRVDYTASILPILTKLKQVCDHPAIVSDVKQPLAGRSEKFDWILERVETIIAGNEQVLIFSHFLGMLDLLQQAMIKRGIPYVRIDGSTHSRQDIVDRFNEGKAKVGLFSIRAAGHGLTVTAANHVIHADRWWNPAVENQATDRVHRIGQTKTVYVYRIMVENTLEERIEKLLQRKQSIADQIVGSARQETQQWTREELLEIL